MNRVDWKNLYKVRIANSKPEFQKHEVVKTLLVMKLIHKNKNKKNWIRVYTEQDVGNGTVCDVYFENVKDKSIVMYEIQKQFSQKWLEQKKKEYSQVKDYFMKTDFIPIDLRQCPDDINEINKWLDQYVV